MATQIVLDDVSQLAGIYEEIERAFDGVSYESELTELSDELQELHRGYFDRQADPTGANWPPLAPSTVAEKKHDRILFRTGRLAASLAGLTGDSIRDLINEGDNQGLSWGTAVEYSIFHQEAKRLPVRKHVGLNAQRVDALAENIADVTVGDLTRGF